MALPWERLGQAASVLQLTGVDAMGLVSMIVQAAHAARRNREQCQQLAQHVQIVGGLLRRLQIPELRRHPETRRPLDQLNDALLRAFVLVRSCSQQQETTSRVYQLLTGADVADKLRRAQEEIDRYTTLIPTITTIAILRGRGTYQEEAQDDAPIDLTPAAQRPSLSLQEVPALLALGELPPTGAIAGNVVSQPERSGPSWFAFAQLEASTNHFAPTAEIGVGILGKMYRGVLPDGSEVAIKRCKRLPRMNQENFRSRLELFSRIRHRHLLGLMGYCSNQDGEWLFVYDYMKNGSLHDHLTCGARKDPVVLSWKLRFRILLGASRGIEYLHSSCVIHGNIKLSNIMMDGAWTARVSDFQTEPDPEEGREDDLYNFGIVMAQVLMDHDRWRNAFNTRSLTEALTAHCLDKRASVSNLEEEKAVDLVRRTAKRCLELEDSGRLATAEIVATLERAVALCEGRA